MQISISRASGIPLATQIAEQVVLSVSTGDLKVGDPVPTIRQLASFLGINRNTVAQAYRALENDGYVTSRVGSGTWIADSPATREALQRNWLAKLVRKALDEAEAMGVDPKEFGLLAYYEGMQRHAQRSDSAVLVLELYEGELAYFCEQIRGFLQTRVEGMLLGDLQLRLEGGRDPLLAYDLALVPFYCFDRAQAILAERDLPLLSIGVGPSLSALVQIAQVAQERRVLIICTEPSGVLYMEDALAAAGITFPELRKVSLRDPGLREALAWADVLIVSQGAADSVRPMAPGKEVILYSPIVNESSMTTVRTYAQRMARRSRAHE
jgi:DNA-binding transcriptional regulator YhcF (GntR family)